MLITIDLNKDELEALATVIVDFSQEYCLEYWPISKEDNALWKGIADKFERYLDRE